MNLSRWALILVVGVTWFGPELAGADPPPAAVPLGDQDKVELAVQRATRFLLTQQRPDGAIWDRGYNTAMTSLAIISLSATGHRVTDETPEGVALQKALAYVLGNDRIDENGYFGARDASRMYGHGIITLMLAELLGMGRDEAQDQLIRDRLEKAVSLIRRAQEQKAPNNVNHYGGWRYEPHSGDSDLSVTIWLLLALRAAKNAGVDLPKEPIDRAVAYVKHCYYSPRDAAGNPQNPKTGCGYQPGAGVSYTMASAGLLALQLCGEYQSPEVKGAADWLLDQKLNPGADFFFYGTYYYAQGMYQRGGAHAEAARRNVQETLLPRQQADGSWQAAGGNEGNAGRVYTTSMAIMSLSVQYHFLPIYQR